MKGMIFAAGLGTRLKPLTDTLPKALVPLAGKTLLQWQVEKLREAGITDIVVNVHHFPDQIIEAVRASNGWGTHITISDERDQLLDTGGGLRKAWRDGLLGTNEPVLACNVDILSNIDLPHLIDTYTSLPSSSSLEGRLGGVFSSLLVVSDRPTQRYLLFDEQDLLCGWTNIKTGEVKPASLAYPLNGGAEEGFQPIKRLAFSGMQILSPDLIEYTDRVAVEKGDKFSLIDLYLSTLHGGNEGDLTPLKAYIPQNYRMMDVGKIDQIAEAEAFAESLL